MTDEQQEPATILAFERPKLMPPADGFRKALACITVLAEMSAPIAIRTIEYWVEQSLLTEDERQAIYEFYKII